MARILLISDTHIRGQRPEGRTDNFEEAQLNKWEFIFKVAKAQNIHVLVQAGDFFDSPNPSLALLNNFVKLFQEHSMYFQMCAIYGQHDMYFRNPDLNKSAFGLLSRINMLHNLSYKPYVVPSMQGIICGLSFGQKDWSEDYWYRNQQDQDDQSFQLERAEVINNWNDFDVRMLVVHDMIGDTPIYPGQPNFTDAHRYLRDNDSFDIILCGDYHFDFHIEEDGRHIINTGCLLRLSRDKRDSLRKPHFYIYDTDTKQLKKFYIPVKPADQVFSEIEYSGTDEKIQQIIDSIRENKTSVSSFDKNLQLYLEKIDRPEIEKIIYEALHYVFTNDDD
jgi:DNA repair exonuclease SbcCD nuclease subunit